MRELREILCKYCEEFYSEPCRRSKERCTPRDQAITAIIELIKRSMPEKERIGHDSGIYLKAEVAGRNQAITEMHAVLDKLGGKEC